MNCIQVAAVKMPQPNGDTKMETSVKWRKDYRQYRSSRCRLYLCMILLMLFIALSAICATFLFRNSFYFHPKDYELNRGEMRAAKASTLFCESIVVKSASFKRQIIVSSSPLARCADRNKFVFTDVVLLRRDRTWYRSFYLLAGSTVNIRVASRHSVNVYWLKGRKILDKWNDEMSKDLKEPSKKNSDKFTGTRMAEEFTVNEDNNYYLGITSIAGNTKYSEIFVNMSINRTTYHASSYVTSCNASVGESCQVKLRFNSPDTALITVPNNVTALHTRDVWVTWYCEPRIWFYAAVFGGSLVLVVLVLSFAYCCFISKVNKKIHKWKPHVVAVRRESSKENNGGVTLTSINLLGGTLDENYENRIELTPLRLTPAGNTCHDNSKPDMPSHSTPNGLNNNNPSTSAGLTSFTGANYIDSASEPPEIAALWRPPSPRWSTFLSDDDYEECVTNFRESPISTLDSIKKASEDEDFECELNDRLQNLQAEYDGPVETDIDNADSETRPFLDDESVYSESDVILRQKDKRKEQRWEPRLSVVTEI